MSSSKLLFLASSLILALACGGGGGGGSSTPTKAKSLVYTNPTAVGFQLVQNTTLSTPTHLVLDVVDSTGRTAQGFAFTLTVDGTRAAFGPVTPAGSDYVKEGTVFNLGTGTKALVGKATVNNTTLQVGAFQKGGTAAATLSASAPMMSVAVDLKPSVAKGAVTLTATQAFSSSGAATSPVTLNLGTLTAK